ncbi:hypothetical protein [Chitinophaga sp. 212800010-3]|uniref:hypothetical protein n=1 Tax=unclassified Chitinophaga TaxID=2619133 RepID=UPI002DE23B31|nr:Transposase [Chitinophaga sp. 212800010-3]
MYLRYQLESKKFSEPFTIDYPVADAQQSKDYMKMLLSKQGEGKRYSHFALLDMAKNVIERYPLIRKKIQQQKPIISIRKKL